MKKNMLGIGLLIVFLSITNAVWAFGSVHALTGKVSVINLDGIIRELSLDSRVEVSETIVTGDASEVLIKTDDDGVVFLKSNSKLVIESFSAKGNDKDNFAVKLLKGAFRGVTGFIGKTAPKRYRLKTPAATVGIRGTDYEIEVVDEFDQTKFSQTTTFAKVNLGEISLTSRGVSVNVDINQFAVASGDSPPHLLDKAPTGLFGPSQLDEKIEQLIKANASDKALKSQRDEQKRSGGNAASGEPRIPQNCASDNPAQRTLDDFIRAYERGDIGYIQRRLDPAMIGYGTFLNNMMEDANNQKQIRFLISNRNAQCGSDLAVINFRWEKRYLDLVTFQPRLQSGQASVLTYLKAGEWRLSGISGDNPFASSLQQICTPSTTSTFVGTGIAAVNQPLNGFNNPPSCPPTAAPTCNIGGVSGIVIASNLICSGIAPGSTPYNAIGSVPFSSTGTSSSTALVTQVIPVTGNSGNGQTVSGTMTCQATITYPAGTPICTVR